MDFDHGSGSAGKLRHDTAGAPVCGRGRFAGALGHARPARDARWATRPNSEAMEVPAASRVDGAVSTLHVRAHSPGAGPFRAEVKRAIHQFPGWPGHTEAAHLGDGPRSGPAY